MHFNILGRFGINAGRAVKEDGVAFEDGTAVHRLPLSDDPPLACPSCGKPGAVHGHYSKEIRMTQAALADLFQTSRNNITMHIQNIYKEGELMEEATSKPDLLVRNEGSRTVKRTIKLYNLKMIIAIGMRAKSSAATSYRIWANNVLR